MDYASPEITELAKALIGVQRDMSPVTRDAVNPFVRNRYATLNATMEACREALLAHGVWLTQLPVPAPPEYGPGHIALLTKLTHAESGQWQSSVIVAPLPKNDPQGMGSAITYCRRYALTAMLGMVTEDDDGEGARAKPARDSRKPDAPRSGEPEMPDEDDDPANRLPQLKGVTWQTVRPPNGGRPFVMAVGRTSQVKTLKDLGFHWHTERKTWWKYLDEVA